MKKINFSCLFTLIIGLSVVLLAMPVKASNEADEISSEVKEMKAVTPPVATAATDISSNSFKANWNAVANASVYYVRVVDESTQEFVIKDQETTKNFLVVTGLKSKNTYRYFLKVKVGDEFSDYGNWIDVTTLPAAPIAKAATAVTSTSFIANWDDLDGEDSYLLRVTDNETQDFILKDYSLQEHSYNVTGLKANHSYSYAVIAVYSSNVESGISNWIDVTTAQSAQSAPIAKAATEITSTSFTANWGDVEGATSFLLRVTDDATQDFILKDYSLQAFSYKVTGLKANHSYSYAVFAVYDSNVKSGISNWVDVTTASAAPVAKAATEITSTSFTANWGDVDGATSFLLRVTDDATQDFILKDYSIQGFSYKVTGLKANHSYSYAVIARFDSGVKTEISNWVDVTTAQSAQSAPIAKAATEITFTSFTANWGDVDGATSFLLRVSDEATQEFILKDYAVQGYSYKVTGLKANHSYTYAVIADFGSDKKSEISNWIDVTTLPAPPVAKAATAITSSSFTANWGDVVGATSFLLRVTDDVTQEFILKDYSLQGFSYKVTGLKANHSYSYAVIACFDWGAKTEISNWVDVKTAVATGIEDGRCSNLRIYPNPATDYISVDGLIAGTKVELFSANGQVAKSVVAKSKNETISLSGIEKGLYLVVIKNENGQREERIMVK